MEKYFQISKSRKVPEGFNSNDDITLPIIYKSTNIQCKIKHNNSYRVVNFEYNTFENGNLKFIKNLKIGCKIKLIDEYDKLWTVIEIGEPQEFIDDITYTLGMEIREI